MVFLQLIFANVFNYNGKNLYSALDYVSKEGYLPIIKFLIDKKIDIYDTYANQEIFTIFPMKYKSIIYGYANILQFDFYNDKINRALWIACIYDHVDVVEYLISVGADINDKVLIHAINNGYIHIVKILLKNGAKFDGHIFNELGDSIYNNYGYEMLSFLLPLLDFDF